MRCVKVSNTEIVCQMPGELVEDDLFRDSLSWAENSTKKTTLTSPSSVPFKY